ncbi:MAG TPA: exopolysaccharide transport family protein [Xanthobacteraceae bacterium]|nr:exopolysaccharide transport family protein [Xanthobacteraceae bacterium]
MAPELDASLDGELDLGAVGRALWRKKLWILIPTLLAAVLSFTAVNMMAPRYKSEARIIIEGRENVFLRPEAERSGERDRAVIDQEAVNSQVQLALSREVARQVIKQLKLSELPEFDPVLRGVGPVKQFLILAGLARDPLLLSPEERVFESYYDRLQAYQIDRSRVIVIEFQSTDPELAARAANAVAEAYLAVLQVAKQEQTKAASEWLAGEIETLRTKVAEAESKAEEFRSRSNLFVGANNNTLSNQQLGEVNSQVAAARAQQAEADAKARSIRDMLRSGRAVEAGEVINSELIRRLNEQRITLRAQLAEQSSTLLGGHPRIKELRAQIADLERQIRDEAERQVRALENDAAIAGARVEQLRANLEQLKRQAASTNEQDVQLRALEREAKAQRDLLESYLAKYRESTARETLGASPADARVISRAIVSNTPYFPKKLPIVLIATFATLLLAAGFIATGELLAGNVYRSGMEHSFAPQSERSVRLSPYEAATDPTARAAHAENIMAAVADAGDHSVSAAAATLQAAPAGRSRAAVVGLASGVATQDVVHRLVQALSVVARTVVVDLSFAAAAFAKDAAHQDGKGVADLVRGNASFGEIIARDPSSRAHIVAAGNLEGEAAAVLSSERLVIALDALERTYEHVIIDFGALPDISDERLARLAPSIVLLASADMKEALPAAEDRFLAAGCREVIPVIAQGNAFGSPEQSSVASAA